MLNLLSFLPIFKRKICVAVIRTTGRPLLWTTKRPFPEKPFPYPPCVAFAAFIEKSIFFSFRQSRASPTMTHIWILFNSTWSIALQRGRVTHSLNIRSDLGEWMNWHPLLLSVSVTLSIVVFAKRQSLSPISRSLASRLSLSQLKSNTFVPLAAF